MLEDIKEDLDIEEFFQTLRVRRLKKTTSGYQMSCFSPDHNDSDPSLHYKTDSHKFFCYGCGIQGDIIDAVQIIKEMRFRPAIRWIKQFSGWTSEVTDTQLMSVIEKREQASDPVETSLLDCKVVIPAYFHSEFQKDVNVLNYIEEVRRWDVEKLSSYGVGFCSHGKFRDRIVFPVRNHQGVLTTFAARTVIEDEEDRWLYPANSLLSQSIWGLEFNTNETPIFLEGCPDAYRLREYGYNAFAVLGSQLGETKLDLISNIFKEHETMIVVPDADKGGNEMKSWFLRLKHQFHIRFCEVPSLEMEDGKRTKDVDEVGKWYGREPVDEMITNSISSRDFVVEQKTPDLVTDIVDEKREALEDEYDDESLVMSQSPDDEDDDDEPHKEFLRSFWFGR